MSKTAEQLQQMVVLEASVDSPCIYYIRPTLTLHISLRHYMYFCNSTTVRILPNNCLLLIYFVNYTVTAAHYIINFCGYAVNYSVACNNRFHTTATKFSIDVADPKIENSFAFCCQRRCGNSPVLSSTICVTVRILYSYSILDKNVSLDWGSPGTTGILSGYANDLPIKIYQRPVKS